MAGRKAATGDPAELPLKAQHVMRQVPQKQRHHRHSRRRQRQPRPGRAQAGPPGAREHEPADKAYPKEQVGEFGHDAQPRRKPRQQPPHPALACRRPQGGSAGQHPEQRRGRIGRRKSANRQHQQAGVEIQDRPHLRHPAGPRHVGDPKARHRHAGQRHHPHAKGPVAKQCHPGPDHRGNHRRVVVIIPIEGRGPKPVIALIPDQRDQGCQSQMQAQKPQADPQNDSQRRP